MPKYFTDLYQIYLKQNVGETNFIHKDDFEGHNVYLNVNVYLDVSDLFGNPDKTNNILNGEILGDDWYFYLYYDIYLIVFLINNVNFISIK
jgi:hypothetical protein